MAIFLIKPVLPIFTVVGSIIWCDIPQVRMWKILYTNNSDFYHLGRSQICWYYFSPSKSHSGTLWAMSNAFSGTQRGPIFDRIQKWPCMSNSLHIWLVAMWPMYFISKPKMKFWESTLHRVPCILELRRWDMKWNIKGSTCDFVSKDTCKLWYLVIFRFGNVSSTAWQCCHE